MSVLHQLTQAIGRFREVRASRFVDTDTGAEIVGLTQASGVPSGDPGSGNKVYLDTDDGTLYTWDGAAWNAAGGGGGGAESPLTLTGIVSPEQTDPILTLDGNNVNNLVKLVCKSGTTYAFLVGENAVAARTIQGLDTDTGDTWGSRIHLADGEIELTPGGDAGVAIKCEEVGFSNRIGVFGSSPIAQPEVTGSRGGNAALASLLTALADLGWITDSTS
jgi:hypothetical protein